MTELNVYEQAILRLLKVARRALTTSQIADRTGIAWETAKKYLDTLHRKRFVSKQDTGNRIYWKIK